TPVGHDDDLVGTDEPCEPISEWQVAVCDQDVVESGARDRRNGVVDRTVETEARAPEHRRPERLRELGDVVAVARHEGRCRPSRLDDPGGHAPGESSPFVVGEHSVESCLGGVERLHRDDDRETHHDEDMRPRVFGGESADTGWAVAYDPLVPRSSDIRVAVIGAGSWGTTVAALASLNTSTVLWARRPDLAREIDESHTNEAYLPSFVLPTGLGVTDSIGEAVGGADVVVMAVPSHGFRDVASRVAEHLRPWVPVVSLTKGLERETSLRMTEVAAEEMPGRPIGVMTGPNLAREVLAGHPAASVVAIPDATIAAELQRILGRPTLRIYTNPDVVGCEVAGVVKNVIAIAAGMAAGMEFGENSRATLITRGLAEMSRLGVAMGGDPLTFAGLAGMGDLIATCSSSQSRNHSVGLELGRGRPIEQILASTNMVAEGVKSSPSVLALAGRYGVEMPITEQVVAVCHEGRTARDALAALLARSSKSELDPS
ncbi:MAG: NAD(P)H-dependent glycerol-3-phosphate dehydrogenase, partial [Actinomycetota bacterium]